MAISIETVRRIRNLAMVSSAKWDAAIERQPEARTGEWAPDESVYLRQVAQCDASDVAGAANECEEHWGEAVEALLDDDLAQAIEHLTDARHLESWALTNSPAALGLDLLRELATG